MLLKAKKDSHEERLLDQERLILYVTEVIVGLMREQNISRQDLASRLGKSKGLISQLLSGERNLTLRTLADLGHVLGYRFALRPVRASARLPMPPVAITEGQAVFATEYERSTGEARWAIPAGTVAALRNAAESGADSHEYAVSHEYGLAA
jgi:transcriptional regulator with XRE-family HTH domain